MIIGIGTGRSGTMSLARLLDGCEGAEVTHEAVPVGRWGEGEEEALQWLGRNHKEPPIWGDVAYKWLPYVGAVLDRYDDVRVVSVRRRPQEVARSYMRFITAESTLRAFPDYVRQERSEEAFLRYAKEYQARVNFLAELDDRVTIFGIRMLNSREGQDCIFEAAGIPRERRFFQDECHYNAG